MSVFASLDLRSIVKGSISASTYIMSTAWITVFSVNGGFISFLLIVSEINHSSTGREKKCDTCQFELSSVIDPIGHALVEVSYSLDLNCINSKRQGVSKDYQPHQQH